MDHAEARNQKQKRKDMLFNEVTKSLEKSETTDIIPPFKTSEEGDEKQ